MEPSRQLALEKEEQVQQDVPTSDKLATRKLSFWINKKDSSDWQDLKYAQRIEKTALQNKRRQHPRQGLHGDFHPPSRWTGRGFRMGRNMMNTKFEGRPTMKPMMKMNMNRNNSASTGSTNLRKKRPMRRGWQGGMAQHKANLNWKELKARRQRQRDHDGVHLRRKWTKKGDPESVGAVYTNNLNFDQRESTDVVNAAKVSGER